MQVTLPGGREMLLTRRHFLYGAAGLGALAVLGGANAYANERSKNDDTLNVLTVPSDAVYDSQNLQKIENVDAVAEVTATARLPYGTLLWSGEDTVAACLLPTETAKPLAQVGLLWLESGECTTVLERAVGEDDGFEIYDVRANGAGVIWTEADIMDGIWRVYGAPVQGDGIGSPQLLDEGDGDWEMPTLACANAYGYWQCLPQLSGNARVENSVLKRAKFGTDEAEVVYESQGRMACPPTSCGEAVVITPRARTGGTYYQMTRIDGATGAITDACVLPASMKPMECSYGRTGFAFAFDAIYNYGDGIANLGTYLPLTPVEAATTEVPEDAHIPDSHYLPVDAANASTQAYSDDQWFRYARTPSSAPCWCGKWLLTKGTTNMCAIDLENKRYVALPIENGSESYHDVLASTGMGKRAVTYCNINFTPVKGDPEKYCLVRIWKMKKYDPATVDEKPADEKSDGDAQEGEGSKPEAEGQA